MCDCDQGNKDDRANGRMLALSKTVSFNLKKFSPEPTVGFQFSIPGTWRRKSTVTEKLSLIVNLEK